MDWKQSRVLNTTLRVWQERIWPWIYSSKPEFISRDPQFNFITFHYCWIVGMAIVGSIIMYPNGGLKYIDALFFAAGSATQSGLNPVDVNLLDTRQQLVLYFICMLCNPITINSFVVFLRLYWFQKRFQNIAKEARRARRSISKTFSKSKTGERDADEAQRGVNGRNIVVIHRDPISQGESNSNQGPEKMDPPDHDEHIQGSEGSSDLTAVDEKADNEQPHIYFADQGKPSGTTSNDSRLPTRREASEHIAFLESQRNSDQGEVLRIPNPREAEAGMAPQAVQVPEMLRKLSRATTMHSSRRNSAVEEVPDDDLISPVEPELGPKRRITIKEPAPPRQRDTKDEATEDLQAAAAAAASPLRFRLPKHRTYDKNSDGSSLNRTRTKMSAMRNLKSVLSLDKIEGSTYLSWEPTIGRNSLFVNLSEEQREELGGIEYRSLKTLALVLVVYFFGFGLFAILCLLPWIMKSDRYGDVVKSDGQGRVWWGIFTANSAFNDLGFTLTPDSMISFNTAVWPLLSMSFLIIIGNTGFPVMLRFVIWVTSKYIPRDAGLWEELRFLLDHPRRCFTLLFPSGATWWLFTILALLNAIDLLFFIILDLGNPVVTQYPLHIRFLDGWFQAVSTRTAGFGVVNIAELHPGIQVSYLIMMYISVFPIAISVRRTNVYEENALGIYTTEEEEEEGKETSYVGMHLRRQLSFDLWYIFLGLFIISIAEGHRIASGDPAFTLFSVLFEIVSAYGTVGLSLGYTNINASFSAEFNVISKLVIIAMQIRGRHRGLPYRLDRAILLPGDRTEEQAINRTMSRVNLNGSTPSLARSRARSTERPHHNLLGSLLHPGPTLPPGYRRERRPSAVSHNSAFSHRFSSDEPRTPTENRRRSIVSMHSGFEYPHERQMQSPISEYSAAEREDG